MIAEPEDCWAFALAASWFELAIGAPPEVDDPLEDVDPFAVLELLGDDVPKDDVPEDDVPDDEVPADD